MDSLRAMCTLLEQLESTRAALQESQARELAAYRQNELAQEKLTEVKKCISEQVDEIKASLLGERLTCRERQKKVGIFRA